MYHKLSRLLILVLFAFLLWPTISLATTVKVVGIADGDTITVLTDEKEQHRIRLYGIDTPESGQAFGRVAKEHLKKILTPEVTLLIQDRDRYGRLVAVVFDSEGRDLNRQMVKDGYAWVYLKYCRKDFCLDWQRLQREAMQAGLGLWKDSAPIAPWKWRQGERNPSRTEGQVQAPFSGNTKSRVAHREGCRHYDCKHCSEGFQTASEAKNAGFRLCQMCN